MKIATSPHGGQRNIARQWFGFLAIAGSLLTTVNLDAQTKTATTVATLGGGPQSYNPNNYFGSSNSVNGTLRSQFHTPSGIAMDNGLDLLYVADRDNNAVRYLDLAGGQTYTLAPYPPYIPVNLISKPVGVAVDDAGNVFVLNRGNGNNGTVVEIDFYGDYFTNMTGLTNASGIMLDTLGDIYVTASNTVFRITPAGVSNVVVTITNAGTSLQGIVVKRSGTTAGLLAVCDSGRNGIYLINPTNGVVTTNAGFNGVGDGTGINNRGVANSRAQFFQPSGLAEAGDGSLIVSDFGNQRVKVVAATGYTTNLYGVASNLWWTGKTSSGEVALSGWSDGTVWEPDVAGDVQGRMPFGVAIGSDGTVYTTEDYYHIIREITGANIQAPPPWPPAAPTSPTATAGYGQVLLTWTTSPGATNYNVKRSTTNNAEIIIASTPGTTYTDTNVLDGTTYYYVVSALNTGGESPNSTEVSAKPLFSPAPASLIVVTTNFGLVSLAWAPSAGATSYNLKRSQSHGGTYNTLVGSTASITFDDTTVVDGITYYYVVTAVNAGGENHTNSPEAIGTAPLPPVPDPQIGWANYQPNSGTYAFIPYAPGSAPFNNDVPIIIVGAIGSTTHYICTNTPDVGSVPDPTNSLSEINNSPPFDGTSVAGYVVNPPILPYTSISAVGEAPGHPNSDVVRAQFQFAVAPPSITGTNAAMFTVTNLTIGAQMYYTTDGSDPNPTNAGATGPISSGQILSLSFGAKTNLLVKMRGFKDNYQPSDVVSNLFSIANYVPNTISFGFASGEASSEFIAAPGQTFVAPVTLTTLSGTKIYSLQFNMTVTNAGPNPGPPITAGAFGFQSMLMKPGATDTNFSPPFIVYEPILPLMFEAYAINPPPPSQITNIDGVPFVDLTTVNTNLNLLGVGWLERYGRTNLYNTAAQTLITYSMAHDDLFPTGNQPNGVIVGGYAFVVPGTATNGQTYQIQIGRPSATDDGVGAPGSDVYIATPTNGSMAGGAINAIKNVKVGSAQYLVGDAYPFRWFNAGDFGDTNLNNADVEQVFEAAIYKINSLNSPLAGSDFFDAMDSSGNLGYLDNDTATPNFGYYTNANPNNIPADRLTLAQQNALFNGNDLTINTNIFGDDVLDVCDVYVTYRRSLDPSLYWFQRFWTNGVRVAETTPNVFVSGAAKSSPGGKVLPAFNSNTGPTSITNTPSLNFVAGDFQATASQTIQIPVTASVFGSYPLRVAMLNISVVPLDGSPALTTPISFSPGAALGTPTFTDSHGNGNYAATWLNSAIAGISNSAPIGTLTITIPASATSLSAYAVHFDHASGSPNGLATLPKHTLTGLITLSSRNNSSYNDGIPDSWRLRWFGTVNNQLSVSNACPSGDGVSNWKKYIAGVDPNTPNDFPGLNPLTPPSSGAAMSIYWPTVSGKQYEILSSASLFPGTWTTNAIVTGNGGSMEFDDSSGGPQKYYRVQILP